MRTTVNISDHLLAEAKATAAGDGRTLAMSSTMRCGRCSLTAMRLKAID